MESLARLSGMLETARDLTIEAAQSASAAGRSLRATTTTRQIPAAQLKKLLDSRHEREVHEGLRKVISMMYRSQDCQPFFSSVIKNIASPTIEIKKLVYIYLVRYAESEPDLALLSINTIQKSLADQNAQIRALALRVMSAIRVPVISQIVSLAIKRGTGDMSPYVRKAAAMAIPKCYRLDPSELPQLIDYLSILLNDKQYYVAGVAVMAYMEICPDRIDLIHKAYRSIVRKLVDMDEWAQLATLKMMLIYGRKCFPERPGNKRKAAATTSTTEKNFYSEEKEDSGPDFDLIDADLDLFLKASKNLLHSRNPAVIVEVAACYLYLAPEEYVEAAVGPVISLLRSPQDIQHLALHNVVAICLRYPKLFIKYATHFLVRGTDPEFIWRLKLEILVIIFPNCNKHMRSLLLTELEHFSRSAAGNKELVEQSVRALGRCAQTDEETSIRCLKFLLRQISSTDGVLVSECLTVIRQLIQKDPAQHAQTVVRLAANLDKASSPTARASIIWLVGEFAGQDSQAEIAPDVLRVLLRGFADESEEAKMQILLLTAKIYLHYLNKREADKKEGKDVHRAADEEEEGRQEEPIVILWDYVLLLVRYDVSFDLRDRARTLKNLLSLPSGTQLATLLLLAQKPVPKTESPFESYKKYTLGSSSLVISSYSTHGEEGGPAGFGHGFIGYKAIPERVRAGQEPDPKLREEVIDEGSSYGEKSASAPAGDALDRALREEMAKRSAAGGINAGTRSTIGAGTSVTPSPGAGAGSVAKAKEITLDDWLKEDDPVEDEEEEEEEEEAESSESGESEESEEDESEEEEDEEEDGAEEGASQKLIK